MRIVIGCFLLFLTTILWLQTPAIGQEADSTFTQNQLSDTSKYHFIEIDKIFIVGNRKTKDIVIERELDLKEGNFYYKPEVEELIERNRQKLINLQLFLNVDISIVELSPNRMDVIVRLTERWYFFPIPILELGDRNFSEWWINQNRDLSRLEYGMRLKQFNFRGMNETISLTARFGFTRLFQMSYTRPAIDRRQRIGLQVFGEYSDNKTIAVNTENHRLNFVSSEEILRERYRAGLAVSFRPTFYNFHIVSLFFNENRINDTIALLNPNYLLDGRQQQKFVGLSYNFRRDFRDIQAYALKGHLIDATIIQNGIGIFNDIRQTILTANYAKFFDLGKRWYLANGMYGSISFPDVQPYRNLNGIGFNQAFMRGYDIYVIEGQHVAMSNTTVKRQIFSSEKDLGRFAFARQFSKIPIDIYITAFYDQGFVANYINYEQNNLFTNQYLYGTGVGVDLVSFYDFVMRFEYSLNKAGETGLRFNIKAAF
ncbi:MAG: POTRA domain-containing protein [Cyclobacteriaceae bacterium]